MLIVTSMPLTDSVTWCLHVGAILVMMVIIKIGCVIMGVIVVVVVVVAAIVACLTMIKCVHYAGSSARIFRNYDMVCYVTLLHNFPRDEGWDSTV
jgi:hypothetical protein